MDTAAWRKAEGKGSGLHGQVQAVHIGRNGYVAPA